MVHCSAQLINADLSSLHRSWNCYGGNVDQQKILSVMDAIIDRSRTVNGQHASLADVGYIDVGLDDNWRKTTEPLPATLPHIP